VLSLLHRAHAVKAVIVLGAIGVISIAAVINLIRERAWGDAALVGILALVALFYTRRLLADTRRANRASRIANPAV